MDIFKEFTFDAAHSLPYVADDHKCKRVHGHTYKVRVVISGELDPVVGWVKDFAEVKALLTPLHDMLDHRYLNDIEGLENPTAEILALWIWRKLYNDLEGLKEVWVYETPTSACVYRGE